MCLWSPWAWQCFLYCGFDLIFHWASFRVNAKPYHLMYWCLKKPSCCYFVFAHWKLDVDWNTNDGFWCCYVTKIWAMLLCSVENEKWIHFNHWALFATAWTIVDLVEYCSTSSCSNVISSNDSNLKIWFNDSDLMIISCWRIIFTCFI